VGACVGVWLVAGLDEAWVCVITTGHAVVLHGRLSSLPLCVCVCVVLSLYPCLCVTSGARGALTRAK
jgi:hypothetical protein